MTSPKTPPTAEQSGDSSAESSHRLILDDVAEQLDRFRSLRRRNDPEAAAFLNELGASGQIDTDIVVELSSDRPLGQPTRFTQAHHQAMQALEVLERNGARAVSAPKRLGPLGAVIAFTAGLVCRFIVRSHQGELIDRIRDLYDRRLAWTPHDHPDRPMLLRASIDTHRATAAFKGNPVGLPTFLLGGAVVSGVSSGARAVLDAALSNQAATLVAGVVVFGLFTLAAWSILRGAATAGHRITLTTEPAMAALWQTIGRAGRPPKNPSRDIAVIGIVGTALAWLVLPAVAGLVLARL